VFQNIRTLLAVAAAVFSFVFVTDSAVACTDFTGDWSGTCVDNNNVVVPDTNSIVQSGCESFTQMGYRLQINSLNANSIDTPNLQRHWNASIDWADNNTKIRWTQTANVRSKTQRKSRTQLRSATQSLLADGRMKVEVAGTEVVQENGVQTTTSSLMTCTLERAPGSLKKDGHKSGEASGVSWVTGGL
jgi:hypothetical protein